MHRKNSAEQINAGQDGAGQNPSTSQADPVRPFAVGHVMVLKLAIPMTLAYMTTPLLGIVDTAVVGRLNDAAMIGGLAVGSIIIDLLFTTFNFLRSGTTGLTAQAVGREDEKESQAILARAIIIALVSGVAMIVLGPLLLWLSLSFMTTSQAVAAATSSYFFWRVLGAPVTLANYTVLGWLIGLGRAGHGLGLQVLINGTNIIFSIVLGLYLGWGLVGVAIGTLIGEAAGLAAGVWLCARLARASERPSRQRIFTKSAFARLLNLNVDIMIRSFALVLAFALFTAKGSQFGDLTLAANAILMHFFIFGGFFLDGLATASEQIVGRAIGARYQPALITGLKLSTLWSALLAVFLAAVFWLFGAELIAMMTTLQEVQNQAMRFLPWAILTPISGMLAFQMDGVFIGATWSRDMSRMMMLSLLIYLAAWQLLSGWMGNDGLWLALHVFLLVRGITLSALLPLRLREMFGVQQ